MKQSISLKLDDDLLEEIDQLTTKELGRSSVIRDLLRYGLAAAVTKGSLVIPPPTIGEQVQDGLDDLEEQRHREVEPRFK